MSRPRVPLPTFPNPTRFPKVSLSSRRFQQYDSKLSHQQLRELRQSVGRNVAHFKSGTEFVRSAGSAKHSTAAGYRYPEQRRPASLGRAAKLRQHQPGWRQPVIPARTRKEKTQLAASPRFKRLPLDKFGLANIHEALNQLPMVRTLPVQKRGNSKLTRQMTRLANPRPRGSKSELHA